MLRSLGLPPNLLKASDDQDTAVALRDVATAASSKEVRSVVSELQFPRVLNGVAYPAPAELAAWYRQEHGGAGVPDFLTAPEDARHVPPHVVCMALLIHFKRERLDKKEASVDRGCTSPSMNGAAGASTRAARRLAI